MTGDPLGLEKIVFNLISRRKIPEFKRGNFFCGDRDWAQLRDNVRRPDIIYFEDIGDRVLSVRPYDVKCMAEGAKMGQISPFTLKSLYDNEDFRNCFEMHMNAGGYIGHDLYFEEGGFVIPTSKKTFKKDTGGFCEFDLWVPRSQLLEKRKKVEQLERSIGYFPFSIYVEKNGVIEDLCDVSRYEDVETGPYAINYDMKSSVTFFDDNYATIKKRVKARLIEVDLDWE